jgi:hypothetical protein
MTEDQLEQETLGWPAEAGHAKEVLALAMTDFKHRMFGRDDVVLQRKAANVAGLQLAAMVVTPIGRQVLGKPVKEDYAIVESKFRRSPHGRIEGYGLMVLPK